MDLYATHNDPRKADFLDANGYTVYHVTTDGGLTSTGTSTVSRLVPVPGGPPQLIAVASIEWHTFKSAVFRIRGLTLKEGDFIHSSGLWTRKRQFTGASGRSYTWTEQVLTVTNGHEVARWHNKSHGIIGSSSHPAYLQIAPDAIQDADDIVTTCVYRIAKAIDANNAAVSGAITSAASSAAISS